MWTRAPPGASDCCIARGTPDQEEGGGQLCTEASPRLYHHRSSNHQAQERRQLKAGTKPSASENTNIHHDLPEVAGSCKRLATKEPGGGVLEAVETLFHMSTSDCINVARVGCQLLPLGKPGKLVGCLREERQLDDMQTSIALNAQPPASSLDQDSELVLPIWSSQSKRRKLVVDVDLADGLGRNTTRVDSTAFSEPQLNLPEALIPEACEDSGLTAEQHMADLDSSKSSTPEDIDSAAHVSAPSPGTSEAPQQCSPDTQQQVGENVEQIPERRQLGFHFSSPQDASGPSQGTSPRYDDTQSTSQFLPIRMDSGDKEPTRRSIETESRFLQKPRAPKTMAGGSDEWLQLSLGSRQSEPPDNEPLEGPQSPTQDPPSGGASAGPSQPGDVLVDFFKSGGSENVVGTSSRHYIDVHGSPSTKISSWAQPAKHADAGGESSSRHYYSVIPESSYRSSIPSLPPFFVEPNWDDPNVHVPRVLQPGRGQSPTHASTGSNAGQFLSPSPILQKGYPQPAYSNLSTLPFQPARVLQPVRSQQTTETTSVNAWRSQQTTVDAAAAAAAGAGPSLVHYGLEESQARLQLPSTSIPPLPWMQSRRDPPRNTPNPADPLSMEAPRAFRDWKALPSSTNFDVNPPGADPASSFLNIQPPLAAQGVDAEQAWRNLLQRVGSNLNVPSGFGPSSSQRPGAADAMLPPPDPQEYMDALKRAVERFQGTDQVSKEESLTELQLSHRSPMFPPTQRPHLGKATIDPSADLARFFNTPSSSGSKARGTASSSERQRRILRPSVPKPGLWFTLQASNSQPEASPLQQIPTAYIRVVDDNMTVAAVKKYLVGKLGLAREDEVELTCKGQPLVPSISLQQVRDGIWQPQPSTLNPANSSSPQLMAEGKAWKSNDGSVIPSIPLQQVRDGIWQPRPSTLNPANSSSPQLMAEGKAWKSNDGSVMLVEDVVMVLTYGRQPQGASTSN